ncbi:MAG TPA: M48 family peptidase [Alphaproteobacteria bacterium]|nr:M48 family peptidase [Alphaproteobacteria bacterium]
MPARMTPALASLFEKVYHELFPEASLLEVDIRFFPFTSLNNTIRLREGRILVRLSDLLEGAPRPVLHAILHILLAKLFRRTIDARYLVRYRKFAANQALSVRIHQVRHIRGRKTIHGADGSHYHLERIFDDLNQRFFHGLMARPPMSWSRNHARRNLGHYDPAHNTIVVSRILDHASVPRYAVEYLVYHEMLHLRHPVRLQGDRRCVHSAAFRAEEKLFPQLAEAKKYLRNHLRSTH